MSQYPRGYGHMRAPQGWVPPYQGAAPPIPPGVNVNPQQWRTGSWAFNPAFNAQRPPAQHVPWIPGQAWATWPVPGQHQPQQQQQQQQQVNHNPYKKAFKPPSAEYLAQPLSSNPLGLNIDGMFEAKDRYGEDVPTITPWIWNPAQLAADLEAPDREKSAVGQRGDPSRHLSEPIGTRPDGRESRSNRHPTDPTSQSTHLQPTVAPFDRPEKYRRHAPAPSPEPAPPVPPAAPATPPEPESFTSKRELQTTFSTNIVRTPNQYWSQSSRGSSRAGSREDSVESLARRVERLSTNYPEPLSRNSSSASFTSASSDSSSSISGVSTFVDEPDSVLSPVSICSATPKHSSRQIGRHHTSPDLGKDPMLSTIAESPRSHAHSTPRPRHQRHSPPQSHDIYPSHRSSRDGTPPRSMKYTPPRDNGSANTLIFHTNPLPTPPREFPMPSIPPTPTLTPPRPPPREVVLAMSPPPRVGPPPANRKRLRQGFWNRRGDHVTNEGYLVYAPHDRSNPPDLKDYPVKDFKDNFGTIVAYNPDRPELPESLPRYGKPPERPYDSFLIYEPSF